MKASTSANLVGRQIRAQQIAAAERTLLVLIIKAAAKFATLALDGKIDGYELEPIDSTGVIPQLALRAVALLQQVGSDHLESEAILNMTSEIYELVADTSFGPSSKAVEAAFDHILEPVVRTAFRFGKLTSRR